MLKNEAASVNEVQDALDGRKRKQGTKIVSIDELPLRGFLECSRCSRILTGSASKGRIVTIITITVLPNVVAVIKQTLLMMLLSLIKQIQS